MTERTAPGPRPLPGRRAFAPMWLIPHPESVAPPIRISVDVGRNGAGNLLASYRVIGDLKALKWEGEGGIGRQHELWRHGCFEAFIASDDGSYIELNMAPTARWAAYNFNAYREGMQDAEIKLFRQDWYRRSLAVPRLELHAGWTLPPTLGSQMRRIGLSAVIEATDGTKSYWALAHAPGSPDFHNPACFTATLPPPASP